MAVQSNFVDMYAARGHTGDREGDTDDPGASNYGGRPQGSRPPSKKHVQGHRQRTGTLSVHDIAQFLSY